MFRYACNIVFGFANFVNSESPTRLFRFAANMLEFKANRKSVMNSETKIEETSFEKNVSSLIFHGWLGLAFWMSFGLLLEGLLGFRAPVYLQDSVRRELFRLAHTHGTVLSLVLLLAAFTLRNMVASSNNFATLALRVGSVLMPFGFLLGGIFHPKDDVGIGIFLAPIGGLMIIFGAINLALSNFKK